MTFSKKIVGTIAVVGTIAAVSIALIGQSQPGKNASMNLLEDHRDS